MSGIIRSIGPLRITQTLAAAAYGGEDAASGPTASSPADMAA